MKPFNLEEAKAGKPVCTRDGRPARIICFDREDKKYPLVVLINDGNSEDYYSFTKNGTFYASKKEKSDLDLFMSQTKHEGWINIYLSTCSETKRMASYIYSSKEEAQKNADEDLITTVKIEWEE